MADIEPPSFSLGLDLDLDPGPCSPDPNPEDEVQLRISDSDPDLDDSPGPVRPLRRLRHGLSSKSDANPNRELEGSTINVDDDIEEFSSQDNVSQDVHTARNHQSVCSSSKLSLRGHGVLTKQSETKAHSSKIQDSSHHGLTSRNSSREKSMFSELTVSPLRRFQLLDSDSDDSSEDEDSGGHGSGLDVPRNRESMRDCAQAANDKGNKSRLHALQTQDFWKDFFPDKSFNVQTPVFDVFCDEYFKAGKDKNAASNIKHGLCSTGKQGSKRNDEQKELQHQDLRYAGPPSHRYFFHEDLKIQRLVRSRLPHFCPLALDNAGNKPRDASVIDYMSQFGHSSGAKQQAGRVNVEKNSRGRKKTKNSKLESNVNASAEWFNPRLTAEIPKDAGKRRIHADGQSSGHWYTAENGRKVYVTKNGQELSGQLAYRHYRKESGRTFKKSKKRSASKKK